MIPMYKHWSGTKFESVSNNNSKERIGMAIGCNNKKSAPLTKSLIQIKTYRG